MDYNYPSLIDLAPNGNLFGSKSIEKCDHNTNLVRINKIQKRFICAYVKYNSFILCVDLYKHKRTVRRLGFVWLSPDPACWLVDASQRFDFLLADRISIVKITTKTKIRFLHIWNKRIQNVIGNSSYVHIYIYIYIYIYMQTWLKRTLEKFKTSFLFNFSIFRTIILLPCSILYNSWANLNDAFWHFPLPLLSF